MQISGTAVDYLIAFTSGVAVSFTPCVYPVMPLTASFIAGANTSGTHLRAFFISLIYVLGMAIVYSALALLAASTGHIFGQLQNHPVFHIIIGVLLLFFALAMFDRVSLPTFGLSTLSRVKPHSLWAVFLCGMTAGLIVGPCTAPVLAALLVYIASKQNMVHGALLMFVFAYGVGFSLILVGTFSGLLSRLPKSGVWLVRIKQIAGLVLLALAAYFLYKGIVGG